MKKQVESPISNIDHRPTEFNLKKSKKRIKEKPIKSWLILLILGALFSLSGIGCLIFALLTPEKISKELHFPIIPSNRDASEEKIYSPLDGREISNADLKNSPAYCIQIPNGLDGARPQVGLTNAGVVFEAIAEAGITRFAAIFQNPSAAVIGPIRSLRIYYLDWDTPFDCAIVHAGGAANALEAVRAGGYKDLTENYAYMYRGSVYSRLWNNLFTTSAALSRFSSDYGYTSSDVKSFTRQTPKEAEKNRIDLLATNKLNITSPTKEDTSTLSPRVSEINLRFGNVSSFNVHYSYNIESNSYLRSFSDGEVHNVYDCGNEYLGEINPEGNCNLVQLSPSVVIAMVVDESRAPGGYYETITTTGSGEVYIFQNGDVSHGTWEKPSKFDQIIFRNDDGSEIKLVPGQAFVSAIPGYGGVEY